VPVSGWWLASYVVLWALVVVLSLVILALARQVGTLHLRLGPRGALEMDDEGPPLGEAPQPIDTATVDGRPVQVGGPGASQLLLFTSPGCPVCREVLPSVPAVARMGLMAPVVISDGDGSETTLPGRVEAPVVAAPEIARRYEIPGTPYVVVLDDLGVVRAKGTVNNLEQMEGLVDTARRRLAEAAAERPG
jgi:methylamine dehydrogenase accessory protein MauD